MTVCTTKSRPARKEYHITDLFFRSELVQLAGIAAGDRWFRENAQGATLNHFHVLALQSTSSADSKPTSPRPKPDAPANCPADPQSPKSDCKSLDQDTSSPAYLSMDEDLPFHLESSKLFQDCGYDIGLLYTDAAHTLITRLSSRNSQ
jgi:hypothetical protein